MSWEAFRLTSKSPAELMSVMGPAGVDHLVREALMACWRSLPEPERTMPAWRQRVEKLWTRNMRVWTGIRKPSPEAFFADLAPYDSDGHFRQALVMIWMMLPRSGGRDFKATFRIARDIFDRNVAAWETDYQTFTTPKGRSGRPRAKPAGKPSKTPPPTAAKSPRTRAAKSAPKAATTKTPKRAGKRPATTASGPKRPSR